MSSMLIFSVYITRPDHLLDDELTRAAPALDGVSGSDDPTDFETALRRSGLHEAARQHRSDNASTRGHVADNDDEHDGDVDDDEV